MNVTVDDKSTFRDICGQPIFQWTDGGELDKLTNQRLAMHQELGNLELAARAIVNNPILLLNKIIERLQN